MNTIRRRVLISFGRCVEEGRKVIIAELENIPVEGTREDKIVVDAELVETFSKVPLVDKPAGFIDYYECIDDPVNVSTHPLCHCNRD
jgi:hypothetical protein